MKTPTKTPAQVALIALRAKIARAPLSGTSDGAIGTWCIVRCTETADDIEALAKTSGCDVIRTRGLRAWGKAAGCNTRSQSIRLDIVAPTCNEDVYLGGGITQRELARRAA